MSDALPVEDAAAEALLGEVVDEFLGRLDRGERPEVEEYAGRHPQLAAVLRQLLPAVPLLRWSSDVGRPEGLQPTCDTGGRMPGAAAPAEGIAPEGPLGDYRIVREVGRGGMGVVYEAVQISLGRRVALKVLPFAAALDARWLQRFKNEAHAAAQLHHTNIVPVYGVGTERGTHFYAMQFIDGQSLAATIAELRRLSGSGPAPQRPAADRAPTGPYTPGAAADTAARPLAALSTERSVRGPAFFRAAAHLGVQAARALDHAHALGVVHRDVKPANLLLDGRGNLWVADFGLAQVQSDTRLTLSGDLVGTLRYMSPEQALAKRVVIDHRTDVYSLGATLYELLTLAPAFGGRDRQELLRQIAFEEPRPPRRLNPALPAELETVVLKALAKNPDERYATAGELADDLERFLKDEPIRARRPTLAQRARKWARRHRPVVATAALAAVLLLLSAVGGMAANIHLLSREQEQTQSALRETRRVNQALERALEREGGLLYQCRIGLAQRLWEGHNPARAEQLLDECPRARRAWEWHYLKGLCHSALWTVRPDRASLFDGVAFSPDGRLLAAVDVNEGLFVWDLATRVEVFALRKPLRFASSVAFSPDGRRLAVASGFSGSGGGEVWAWDVASGREVLNVKAHKAQVFSLAFSPDGRRLATASYDKTAKVWDADTGGELLALPPHAGVWHRCLAYSPDGKYLATGGPWQALKLWDAATGRELHTFAGHTAAVLCVAFSPKGDLLVSAGVDRTARVWDLKARKPVATYAGHSGEVHTVAFTPDGRYVITGSHDQTVRVWAATTGKDHRTYRGHAEWVKGVAVAPDGKSLASAGHDGAVRVWDLTRPQEARVLPAAKIPWGVAFSPDSRLLAAACVTEGLGGELRVWEPGTGRERARIPAHRGGAHAVAFSPDGRLLASGGQDGAVKLWDADTGREFRTLRAAGARVYRVAFSPTGEHVACCGTPESVTVWEAAGGREVFTTKGRRGEPLYCLAFSPDGRSLAWERNRGEVTFLDLRTNKAVRVLWAHKSGLLGLAFSPDGRRLVTASLDRSLKLWDLATGRELCAFRGHTASVEAVAFSPDGARIASASHDNTVRVWETAGGQEVLTLHGHGQEVEGVAFSPDGRFLASAGRDGTVRLWDGGAAGGAE
jgi:WD40 repeat protein/serine/threonine protein kinase